VTADDRSLGQVLKAARLARGWTQATVASAAGITTTHLGDLESGFRAAPPPSTLAKLAQALELDYDELANVASDDLLRRYREYRP
jgi:transcriptional regulator with XRE-family HTH domain